MATKKDHWEWQTATELAEFVREQEIRLNYPTRQEMEALTSPHVSDTVIGQAYNGQLDPSNCKARTLAGLASLANASSAKAESKPPASIRGIRCPHCGKPLTQGRNS